MLHVLVCTLKLYILDIKVLRCDDAVVKVWLGLGKDKNQSTFFCQGHRNSKTAEHLQERKVNTKTKHLNKQRVQKNRMTRVLWATGFGRLLWKCNAIGYRFHFTCNK